MNESNEACEHNAREGRAIFSRLRPTADKTNVRKVYAAARSLTEA